MDPYGGSPYTGSAAPSSTAGAGGLGMPPQRPPRFADWGRQRRQAWRQRNQPDQFTAGLPQLPTTPPPNYAPWAGAGRQSGSFFDPSFNYWATGEGILGGPLQGTPLGQVYFNDPRNLPTAIDIFTGGEGLDPTSQFGQWLNRTMPTLERSLSAARALNPQLDVMEWLRKGIGDLRGRFNALPFQVRGESPRMWGAGGEQNWIVP